MDVIAEIAAAYVSILPSAKGWGQKLEGQIGNSTESVGKKAGKKLMGGIKVAGVAAAATVGGLLATSLTKGFGRLQALEQARAKLTGLGHSAKAVDGIMKNALASVKGTAFGMDEAATVAAGAVAAGIKPGKALERTLKLTGDAATIAGTSMGEMGAIFNKVATSNKIQGDVINQLNDAGIPIIQLLGKTMGKTSAEVTKLASKGKIDFATFQKAMESGLGGAALKSGDTLKGAFANTMAALGRIGANLLSGVYPQVRQFFQGAISFLGQFEDKAAAVGEFIGKHLADGIERVSKVVSTVKEAVTDLLSGLTLADPSSIGAPLEGLVAVGQKVRTTFLQVSAGVKDFIAGLTLADPGSIGAPLEGLVKTGQTLRTSLAPLVSAVKSFGVSLVQAGKTAGPALLSIAKALAPLMKGVGLAAAATAVVTLTVAFRALGPVVTAVAAVLGAVGGFAAAHSTTFRVLTAAVVAGVLAWKAYQITTAAVKAVQLGLAAASYGAAGATYATGAASKVAAVSLAGQRVATLATAAATKVAAAGQWLWNAAMTANPIGLVVAAIGLLVAAVVVAWKNSETFRNVVTAAWNGIKTVVLAVVNWFKTAVPAAWNAVKGATSAAWNAIKGVSSAVWNGIKAVVSAVVGGIKAYVGTQVRLIVAAWNFLSSLPGKVRGWFGQVLSAIRSKLGEAVAFVKGIPAKIKAAFGKTNTLLLEAGKDVIRGLINGIKSMAGAAANAAKNVAKGVADGVKGFLHIGSPSKLMHQYGQWTSQGLADGIKAGTSKATSAAREMARKVAEAARSRLALTKARADVKSWVTATLLPGLGGSPEKVTSTINALGKKVQSALVSLAGPDKDAQRRAINASAAFMRSIKAQTDALVKNAKDRAALADKIKDANAKVTDAYQSMADGVGRVVDAAKSFGSIFSITADGDSPLTGQGLLSGLQSRLAQIKDFTKNVGDLIGKGLDKSVLQQLVEAGPDQGAAYAKALLDAPGIVDGVNALTKQIADESGALGDLVGKELYQPGVDAALKFRDGLLSQDSAMQQAGRALIRQVENGVRAEVGLKPLAMPKVTGAAGVSQQTTVPVNVDGRNLFTLVVDWNKKTIKQTGSNPLVTA